MPKISIVVPVYNTGIFLKECFDSIRSQTFRDFEVVVVDDGSTDNSSEICDEYARNDNRFKVIHKPNGGVSSARNTALDTVSGEYLCFIDSDDYIESDMLEKMINTIENLDVDVVQSDKQICSSKSLLGEEGYMIFNNKELRKEFFSGTRIRASLWLGLYKSSLFKKVRFPQNIVFWEDYAVIASILNYVEKLALINKRYYHYRIRKDSATHLHVNSKTLTCLLIADYLDGNGAFKEKSEYRDVVSFFIKFCVCESIKEKSFEHISLYQNHIIRHFSDILSSKSISSLIKFLLLSYLLFPQITTLLFSKIIKSPVE